MNIGVRDATLSDASAIVDLFHNTVLNVNVRDYFSAQVEAWAGPAPEREKWEKRIAADDTRRTFVGLEGGWSVSRSWRGTVTSTRCTCTTGFRGVG